MSGDDLIGLGEAQAWLAAHWPRPAIRTLSLAEALGRRLVEDVMAAQVWPPRPSAREHGIALVAADTQGAEVYSPVRLAWSSGRVQQVAAGDPLSGAGDAVVPLAMVELGAEGVILTAPVAAGEGVRRAGADVAAGERVLAAGQRVGPLEAARLAALGIGELRCEEPTTLTLVAADEPATAGIARELLARLLRSAGCPVECVDGPEAVLSGPSTSGVTLVCGGSGEAPGDPLAQALEQANGLFARSLALQPGMGTRLGSLGERLIIGLPGQPWPAFAALWMLLKDLLGWRPSAVGEAVLGRKLSSPLGVSELVPLAREAGGVVPLPRDAVLPPARLAGVMVVAEESEGHAAGEAVMVQWLKESPNV